MSMTAVEGVNQFVQQVNSMLATIPRAITVSVSDPVASMATGGTPPQGSQARGVDAETLAEHLYPHIRDRLDAEARLRGSR